MLDQNTKRKIDNTRQILVGKVPDPKAQVEQITIALIYKFMDDMDKESEELGGKAQFFSNGYSQYSWTKLMDQKLSGQDRLDLYVQSISNISRNKNIPQLFRDIFKGAFLPYNDPRTLSLFLKEINEFSYEHSEDLGDSFEYLLSVLGSQGDAGQFRTPRHIIDFIVEAVDPKKNEKILDPACGTAGFLISAFKHILRQNEKKPLTPDEKQKLMNNLAGYDISPDMVKLALVNMYLHGFPEPKIYEYDTLSDERRWDEYADVILANPPFMTPKGGIQPHKRFSIQANKSEILFVDYIAEHLSQNGRAGVIVPEGIIFQTAGAYMKLRKYLIDNNYLWAVVSLPAGIFNPYSPVKTSILFIDKTVAKKTNNILFLQIKNDGFDLGAQRKEIDKNDLPEALSVLQKYKAVIENNNEFVNDNNNNMLLVEKPKIVGKDYVLSIERYRESRKQITEYELVKLADVLEYEQPTNYIVVSENYDDSFKTPVLTAGKTFILGYTNETDGIYSDDLPVIIFDDFTTSTKLVDFPFKVKSSAMKILKAKKEKADVKFLFYAMQKIEFNSSDHKRYWISQYSQIEIPLPPLEIQQQIVSKIESWQKTIDGARQVVENYKPEIEINPDWDLVELGSIASFNTGGTPSKSNDSFWNGSIPWVSPKDMKVDYINDAEDHITETAIEDSSTKLVQPNTLLIVVRSGILKHTIPIGIVTKPVSFNQDIISISCNEEKIMSMYLFFYLKSTSQEHLKNGIKKGVTVESFHSGYFKTLQVSLPSLSEQEDIVKQIEQELEIINGNKRIITHYEQKIKNEIDKLWVA